ncbi:MFS transporter [Oryzobacter telluris]|uniref:MFS transporter n=1 Tax=Oryzobacter telluris TaxID=3149179 RepID=UPI00370D3D3F
MSEFDPMQRPPGVPGGGPASPPTEPLRPEPTSPLPPYDASPPRDDGPASTAARERRARDRIADAGRAARRGGQAGARAAAGGGRVAAGGGRLAARGGRFAARKFRAFAAADGADDSGLARLTEMHAVNVAADAALTISLAGTVFALPTDEARGRVALFLVLTMAPFVLLAPLVGPLLDRFRHGRRWALGTTLATRAFLAWVLASAVVEDSPWLFPAALGCLVASRSYAVARAAAIPRLLPRSISLVTANSRLTIAGLIGMVLGGGIAGGLAQVGPDWSLRFAFAVYVAATVLAIRLPPKVDATLGEVDLDGVPVGTGPLPTAGRGVRRMRALPRAVRYILWITSGARLLSGFLVLFLAFLMREHPIPGWAGPTVLALVAAAAGIGNALGSVAGNLRRAPSPELMSGVLALVTIASGVLTAAFYSVWTLVALGLATGVFGQLVKLCLDAVIQRDVAEHTRARVFSWSETILQAFWVVGGAIGIAIPLEPVLGFTIVTVLLAALCAVAVRARRIGAAVPATPAHPA